MNSCRVFFNPSDILYPCSNTNAQFLFPLCLNLTLVYLRLSFRFVYCLVVWLVSLLHTHTAYTWSNEWMDEEKKRYPNSLRTNTRKYCLCKRSIDDDNVINMRTNSYCVVCWRRKKILLCLGFWCLFNSWIWSFGYCLGRFFYVLEKGLQLFFGPNCAQCFFANVFFANVFFWFEAHLHNRKRRTQLTLYSHEKKNTFFQISLKWFF